MDYLFQHFAFQMFGHILIVLALIGTGDQIGVFYQIPCYYLVIDVELADYCRECVESDITVHDLHHQQEGRPSDD